MRLHIHALKSWLEPLDRIPSAGGRFLIVWPD